MAASTNVSPMTFTIDVEDHRPGPEAELRFPRITRQVIEWLSTQNASGTFFIVGEEAERHPDLVRDIVAGGHEVALHGYRHVPLGTMTPDVLADDVRRGRVLLEDLAQREVVGFRAPQFSLTPDAVWASDVLAEAGFTYSSSVLPNANPLFGFPGAPTVPFRWPSGLVEFPATLLGTGSLRVPLGGIYFRLLPLFATKRLLASTGATVPWIYLHPYDFDPGEKMYVIRDANPIFSPLQWVNRRRVRPRVAALFGAQPGRPLRDRVAEVASSAPVFP